VEPQRPYRSLFFSGELAVRAAQARQMLSCCELCPRRCRANRLEGERGFCGAGARLEVAHFGPHFGEEPPLSATRGAGIIFFTHCNLKCCFCQNHQISHEGVGREMDEDRLAAVMLELQARGCHNLDLVTPTHYLPLVLEALTRAIPQGLTIPLVYNSGGYESVETLKLLEGVVDVYLPDWKYGEEELGLRYSGVSDYPSVCEAAVGEMHRQVGGLDLDEEGIAQRGLIVRHLVLPHHLANSEKALTRLVSLLSPSVRVSLMAQYAPRYGGAYDADLNRALHQEEYAAARALMERLEFDEYYLQELGSSETYLPDFRSGTPFLSAQQQVL
jgi:putative pyruvate formate lyase activating enzyme